MAKCAVCGERLRFGGRMVMAHAQDAAELLNGLERVAELLDGLGKQEQLGPESQETAELLPGFTERGRYFVNGMHRYAHDLRFRPPAAEEAFRWMTAAKNVLRPFGIS